MRQVFHGNIRGIYCVGCSSAPRVLGALQPQEFTLNTDTYTHTEREGASMQLSGEGWQRPLISHACIRSRVSPSCPDPKQLLLRPDLTLFYYPKIKSVLSSDLDAELPGLVADVFHPPNFSAMLKAQTLRRNTCSEGAISSPTALLSCREQLLSSSGIQFASSGRETSPSCPAPASFQS